MTPRQRLRRRLLVVGLLPLLLAVALSTKVALTYHRADTGRDALQAGDADAARSAYAANATLNVLQTWVAPYNEGVAGFAQDDPEAAARLFAAALEQAPTDQQCRVRTNLALALEAVGDAAVRDEVGEALRRWRGARESLAPCLEPPADAADAADDPARALTPDEVAELTTLDRRIADKLAEETTPTEPDEVEDDEPIKGKYADFTDLTPAERRRVLEARNELGRERRERERRFEQEARERREETPTDPEDEPVYNW